MDDFDGESEGVLLELRFEFFGQRDVVANHQNRFGVFNIVGKFNTAVVQNERFAGSCCVPDVSATCHAAVFFIVVGNLNTIQDALVS